MSAWLSFIGGYAKGANEEIDKQREKEDQYIQDRMKMAAATRLQKQKEAEAQRAELKDAFGKLSTYENFNAASKDERVALLGNPMLREQWLKDPTKPISSVVTPNLEKTGKYSNEQSLIDSVQAKPSAVNEQTFAAFQQPRQSFGARVGTDMEGLKQNAARFGMKPEDLGWEQGGVELPDSTGFGTIKNDALAPDDIAGQRKMLESEAVAAKRESESADPAVAATGRGKLEAIKNKAIGLTSLERIIEGGPEKVEWQNEYNKVMLGIVNSAPGSPERKQLEARKIDMEKTMALGKEKSKGDTPDAFKPATFAQLRTATNDAMLTTLRMGWGAEALKGVSMVQVKQSDGSVAEEVRFNKLDTDLQKQQYAAAKASAMAVLSPYIKNGAPTTEAARLLMTGLLSGAAPTSPPQVPKPATPAQQKPAAQQQAAPPTNMLKENVNTTFDNGQTWTLRNGVATRVK